MKINYQETSKDLLTRIDIHEKYGSANIDVWTNELLQPQPGMDILDVGCGAGKLCFLFDDYTKGAAKITGGDFSEELLDKARAKNAERGSKVDFQFLDFNQPFAFADDSFDLCTSAFAIYYASDLDFTFGEAYRVLRPGGRLFVSASKATSSTPLTESSPGPNCTNSKTISPSPKSRRSSNTSAPR
ncbi:MAG: hypothetical protein DCC54_00045 [Anaerolineae bacterium]|nr:MAG: hypothetical protein DCC54_00045 [Anaerolineae bacterium]